MDVAFITTRPVEYDAMSNFTVATATAFKGLGRVSIYAFAYDRPRVDGVEVHMLGGKSGHSIASNVRALLGTFRLSRELSGYDALVIVNPDVGALPACHLAKRHNPALKMAWTFHGLTPPAFLSDFKDRLLTRLRWPAYVASMRRSDRVQVFSDFIQRELTGKGVDPAKISVIPFGVDLRRLAAGDGKAIRERYGIGERFLVLYAGRLVSFKHVDELVRAVALLPGDARLLVVGGGPERPRLEALSEALGVGEKVRFAGRVPDEELPGYFAACDVWATASRHEGFCVPIVEAMACGKPVVVPDVAAMPGTAGDGGLTYRSGDLEGLAGRLRLLSEDGEAYRGLSKKAGPRAAEFDVQRALERYVEEITDTVNSEKKLPEKAQDPAGEPVPWKR